MEGVQALGGSYGLSCVPTKSTCGGSDPQHLRMTVCGDGL